MKDSELFLCFPYLYSLTILTHATQVAQWVRNPCAMQETQVQTLDWEDSPGGGQDNLLQCSCLENPRDGRAWWASVYGVAQNRTRLKRLSSSSSSSLSLHSAS